MRLHEDVENAENRVAVEVVEVVVVAPSEYIAASTSRLPFSAGVDAANRAGSGRAARAAPRLSADLRSEGRGRRGRRRNVIVRL